MNMRRREFILIPVAAVGGTLLYALSRESEQPETLGDNLRVPLRFFTALEAGVVAAACERIFPRDTTGAGASDAAVVIYIDRQLAGPYGRDKYRYVKPPFVDSVPEHGYQGRENPGQIYRSGIRALGDFARLTDSEQDRRLAAIEKTRFFQLLRTHTIEGMFCDPVHGGNADLVGWKLIGYPGPQMSYRNDIDQHFGQAWRPPPASLEQITGRRITPSEDEKE